MMRVSFESPKGGQGLTTTMCGIAAALAQDGHFVSIEDTYDVFAILVMSNQGEGYGERMAIENLHVFERGSEANPHSEFVFGEDIPDADMRFLVIQPCYLALRRFMENRTVEDALNYEGVITFTMEGRALVSKDVQDILDLPIIGKLVWDQATARTVDAGTLARRPLEAYEKLAWRVSNLAEIRRSIKG